MSRHHMLYDDQKLTSIPVKVTNWNGGFKPDNVFKKLSGNGIIIEGCLLGKTRHLIVDGEQKNVKHHYAALHIDPIAGWHRRFDVHGKEIEPDKSGAQKVSTGFLMSSYKDVKKEGTDEIPLKDLNGYLTVSSLHNLISEKLSTLKGKHVVTIWAEEKDLQGIDLYNGAKIRLRTFGSGPLLESIIEMDQETSQLSSYSTGKEVGANWTDKVMNLKESEPAAEQKRSDGDGADDDEWDD